MMKMIEGYDGKYGIDELGNVYSYCIRGSQRAACKYASKHGASLSSLEKYKMTQDWTVESVSTIPEGSSIRDEDGCEVVPEFGIKH